MTTDPNEVYHKKQIMGKAIGIVGSIVVLALIVTGLHSLFSDGEIGSASSVKVDVSDAPERVAASVEAERQAIAKAALSHARDEATVVVTILDKVAAASAAWQNEVLPLLSNNRGKLLAANPDYVRTFDTLHEQGRPTPAEIASARVRISTLLEQVNDALDGDAAVYKPSEERSQLLAAERVNAERCLRSFTEARQTIDAMLVQAEQLGRTASQTLQQAIDNMNRDYAAQQAAVISKQRQRAEGEHLEQLAKLEYEKQTAIHEAERVKRAAELDRDRTRVQTEARLVKEQEERERLHALAESPEIQARFAPFLAKGKFGVFRHTGTVGSSRAKFRERSPMSYSGLKQRGIFSNHQTFADVASSSDNDRPSWPPPKTDDDWKRYREDWELFRELAPLWLEMGKLSP